MILCQKRANRVILNKIVDILSLDTFREFGEVPDKVTNQIAVQKFTKHISDKPQKSLLYVPLTKNF